jgi:hypothetical protein
MAISVSSTLKSNFFCVAIYQVLSRRGIKKGVNTGGDSPWMKSASRPNIRKFRLIKTAVTTPRWGKIRLENKREKFFQLIILCHSVSQDIPGGSWSDFLSSSAHLHWWIVSMWVAIYTRLSLYSSLIYLRSIFVHPLVLCVPVHFTRCVLCVCVCQISPFHFRRSYFRFSK